jgi:CBS domain-containing protein
MLTEFHALSPSDTLGHAADLLLAGSQQVFPVLGDGRPGAVLTREALAAGLAEAGRDGRVDAAALRPLPRVKASEPLVPALALLREQGEPCLEVTDGDRVVGLLTLENIGEFLMIRAALSSAASSARV